MWLPLDLPGQKSFQINAVAKLFVLAAILALFDVSVLVFCDQSIYLFFYFYFFYFFVNSGQKMLGNQFERSVFEIVKMNMRVLLIKTFEISFDLRLFQRFGHAGLWPYINLECSILWLIWYFRDLESWSFILFTLRLRGPFILIFNRGFCHLLPKLHNQALFP